MMRKFYCLFCFKKVVVGKLKFKLVNEEFCKIYNSRIYLNKRRYFGGHEERVFTTELKLKEPLK